jgi:hypothetical protein
MGGKTLNTALILTSDELHGLISLQEGDASVHLHKLIQKIYDKGNGSNDIVATLQEKRLVSWDGHTLSMKPLLRLIINEASTAASFYKPIKDAYALECPNMHLLFTKYQWALDMWRISPFKDKSALLSSLSDHSFQ